MPALTYPDQLTYYAFSREIHPVFAKALNAVPVDPAPMIEQATFIKSLAEGIDSHSCEEKQAIWDRQYELAEELEAKLKAIAIYTASIVLSFDGSDFLGNSRPYDCEAISEPFFSGITLYESDDPGEMFFAVFRGEEIFEQKQAYRKLAEHPFFKNRAHEFEPIESIFECLRMNGRFPDWTLIGILRSYYLFSE